MFGILVGASGLEEITLMVRATQHARKARFVVIDHVQIFFRLVCECMEVLPSLLHEEIHEVPVCLDRVYRMYVVFRLLPFEGALLRVKLDAVERIPANILIRFGKESITSHLFSW